MRLIDGKQIAKEIKEDIALRIQELKQRPPGLAFVLVGEYPASRTYINMKKKACSEVGIRSFDRELPENITEKDLLTEIEALNSNPEVDGILVQMPLPKHINTQAIVESILPEKDVDGFHPTNIGKMLLGYEDGFFPCTPNGILKLVDDFVGKHVVIIGRSNIVGKPLAGMLMQKRGHCNATVTVVHSRTQDLPAITRTADVLIAAMGSAQFVKADMVKEGAIVIDVGMNRIDGKLFGDVDFENVAPKCSAITPVPGGVGPMTIAMLLSNTLQSYERRYD